VNIQEIEPYYELWDKNELMQLWDRLQSLHQSDFAYIIAWITILIKDENDKKLSQWIVWLETKTKNKQYI
jgi:hypothetical protein